MTDRIPMSEHLDIVRILESRIAELEADVSSLTSQNDALSNGRWHATYNAALTGFISESRYFTSEYFSHDAMHLRAFAQADIAHGPLKPEPPR